MSPGRPGGVKHPPKKKGKVAEPLKKSSPSPSWRKKPHAASPKVAGASILMSPRLTESQRKNQRSFDIAAAKRKTFLASLPPHNKTEVPAVEVSSDLIAGVCAARVQRVTAEEEAVITAVFGKHASKVTWSLAPGSPQAGGSPPF